MWREVLHANWVILIPKTMVRTSFQRECVYIMPETSVLAIGISIAAVPRSRVPHGLNCENSSQGGLACTKSNKPNLGVL